MARQTDRRKVTERPEVKATDQVAAEVAALRPSLDKPMSNGASAAIAAGLRGMGVKDAVEVVRAATAEGEESPRTRLSADIRAEDAALLGWLAHATGYNKVTTLVRAIRVLAELVRAEQDGGELTIKYPGGRRERLIIR